AMGILPLFSLYALTFLPATVVSALMRVAPLFTVALTHFFLKGIEKVDWKIGLSTCLIVTGAVLVSLQ
ncbi:EamA family transporter, partial [Candidatus Bipolaricaulota bacterium]|nr:EamA family transporter [Candidatus Bipolaricaulota bacterium]